MLATGLCACRQGYPGDERQGGKAAAEKSKGSRWSSHVRVSSPCIVSSRPASAHCLSRRLCNVSGDNGVSSDRRATNLPTERYARLLAYERPHPASPPHFRHGISKPSSRGGNPP